MKDDKYDVTEVVKVGFPASGPKGFDMKVELLDDSQSSSSMWALDGMMIDEELLYAEDEEADRIYQDLKARSFRRRNMEEKENRLSISMMREADSDEEEERQRS